MYHHVHAVQGLPRLYELGDRAHADLDPGLAQLLAIGGGGRRVDHTCHQHAVAGTNRRVRQPRANEAGATRNEQFHFFALRMG
jgi:hypothetical protein